MHQRSNARVVLHGHAPIKSHDLKEQGIPEADPADAAQLKAASASPRGSIDDNMSYSSTVSVSNASDSSTGVYKKRLGGIESMQVRTSKRSDRSSPLANGIRAQKRRCNVVAGQIVDHKAVVLMTTLLTLYALTGDDIRILGFDKPDDDAFNWIAIVCMAIFGAEVVLSCLGKHDYFLGFFFWLDVFSTASLVLDLTYVAQSIEELLSGRDDTDDNASSLRSGRTAKVGARAARVVRVLRLVRILKLYKHYYQAVMKKHRADDKRKLMGPGMGLEDDASQSSHDDDMLNESRVGRRLSEMTTRRVILLILAMLMVIPNLMAEESHQTPFSTQYGADEISEAFHRFRQSSVPREDYERAMLHYVFYHNWFSQRDPERYCDVVESKDVGMCANKYFGQLFWVGAAGKDAGYLVSRLQDLQLRESTVTSWIADNSDIVQDALYNYGTMPREAQEILYSDWDVQCDDGTWSRKGFSLLENDIGGLVPYVVRCPEDLRYNEFVLVSPTVATASDLENCQLTFAFDLRPFLKQDSWFNLSITLLVMALLVVGALMFSHDANVLVLLPVEKMIKRVEAIRMNPLVAMKMADEGFAAELDAGGERKAKRSLWKSLQRLLTCDCAGEGQGIMETVILENAIIKLGSLLALGFGEAGVNIIGHNMARGAETSTVDAMIPGIRVDCIIGVVRIRDFNIVNEVLKGKIMTFGNQIAEIVHGVCNEFHGAPNKNHGDTFLIIWRMGKEQMAVRSRLAELSVTAFATILGSLHQSPLLASYRTHPGLQQRLRERCRVNLSFGLHAGWAIEGAVGSEYKIDASYLSPTVSITNSIERATEIYDVSLIVSEAVAKLCTKGMTGKCRLIDNVIIKGSTEPVELYAVDLNVNDVRVGGMRSRGVQWNARQRWKARQFIEGEKLKILSDSVDMNECFELDPLIRIMRRCYTEPFFQYFNMGYQNYAQGQWEDAKHWLSKSKDMLGFEDGPSYALLRYMQAASGLDSKAEGTFEAPANWKGVHQLDFVKPKRQSEKMWVCAAMPLR